MKQETTYRTKLRAVFLAAIMVISVVGMSVAFTGAAAATNLDGNAEAYDNYNPYQGQDVIMNASAQLTDANINPDDEYDLRRVNSFDGGTVDSSTSVRDLFAGEAPANDTQILIETDDLDAGDYFVTGGDLTDSNDVLQNQTFEVRIQTIDTYEFDDDEVTDEGRDSVTELEIDSNRGSSNFVVNAGGDLDDDELAQIHITEANIDADSPLVGTHEGDLTFPINASASLEGAISLNDSASTGNNVTVDDYLNILTQARAGVVFEDDDTEEPLNISKDDHLSDSPGLNDNISITNFEGETIEVDITQTTWGELVEANNDSDIVPNPFNALLINEDQDEDPDEKVVLLELRDTEADVDFTDIDDGDYTFELEVADTEATATADITVNEEDRDAAFSQGTYQAGAGDIAHLEFELEDTDEAWIQIGDADSDFADFLYVEIDDADEPVEIAVNTRLLGANGSVAESAVYDVENTDSFRSLLHTDAATDQGIQDFLDTTSSAVFADDDTLYQTPEHVVRFYDDLDLVDSDAEVFNNNNYNGEAIRADMLTRPLQAIDYELQIASDNVDDDDEGVFDSDAGAGEATDQLDSAVLELQAASIGDIRTWTAFEEDADDEDDVAELLEIVTERDEIAYEDRLVVQVEATGLYGGLIAGGPDDNDEVDSDAVDFDRLEDGLSTEIAVDFFNTENIDFEIESETATGQDPLEVNLGSDDSDTYLLIGPDQDQFFLIVDTGSDSAFSNGDAPEDGDTFSAEFEFDADNDDNRFEFGNSPFVSAAGESANNYPYLSQGDVLSASAEFDIAPREISFDNLNADDEVQAENIEDSEISGVTNVAPGSDAELRVSSTDASSSFREGVSVDINEDGEISAAFDFSGQEPGGEFDTRFRAEGSTVDTVDSVIVAEGDLGLEDPVEDDEDDVVDDDDDVVDDDDDVVDDDDDVVDDDDDEVEDVDDETPGFGALVALVALIGAALLAVRRQN